MLPTGFHLQYPLLCRLSLPVARVLAAARAFLAPNRGFPVCLRSRILRGITFRLTADLQTLPALASLSRVTAQQLLGGDASSYDEALTLPHYSAAAMPAVSFDQYLHLMQWV